MLIYKNNNNNSSVVITASIFIICGSILSLIGLAVGILLGVQYGVIFSNYGGGFGYEGAGMLGGFIGVVIVSILLIILWFKGFSERKQLIITYIF
jgi:hypothetical protein